MNFRLLIIISFVSVLFSDAFYYLSTSMRLSVDSTYVMATCRVVSLTCLLIFNTKFDWGNKIPAWARHFFTWMIIWNLTALVRGLFTATDYWDWKYLVLNSVFSMTIPYAVIAGVLFAYTEDLLTLMITKLFVFGYLIIPLTLKIDAERELFPRAIMITISFFILLIPYVALKWRLAILGVAVTSVFLAYDFRSNVVRISFALLLVVLYYVRKYMANSLLKIACILCFFAPIVFLVLGLTGQFNIFKPPDDVDKYAISYDNGTESNLAIDTRTFIYQEVLSSMQKNNSFIFGEGAIGTYKTEYFEDIIDTKKGRYGSEVGFLNMLLNSGVLGVILYALVLFSAIYYAMCYSNNFLCKLIALSLAFRWIMFFVEDFTQYDMNYYFIWLSIGLCLSKDFRAMTDSDITQFFNFSAKKQLTPKLS